MKRWIKTSVMLALILAFAATGVGAVEVSDDLVLVWRWDFDIDLDEDGRPDSWLRMFDRTHPHYVPAGLDVEESFEGPASLKISAGGASAEFVGPVIQIDPDSAYDFSGHIKTSQLATDGLRATSARLEVRLYDSSRNLVATVRGFPSASGNTKWSPVSTVDVTRRHPQCAYLAVVAVLEGKALDGAAWFDSLEVRKRPVATLVTNHARNIFKYSDDKIVTFKTRGMPAGKYLVELTVTDELSNIVHQVQLDAEAFADGGVSVIYPLGQLQPGPYELEVKLSSDAVSDLVHRVRLAILPDYGRESAARNFGFSFSRFPDEPGDNLLLAEITGIGWTKLPVGRRDRGDRADELQAVTELRRSDIMPVGVLAFEDPLAPSPPPAHAGAPARDDSDASPPAEDTPGYAGIINTFAGRMECWQVGLDGGALPDRAALTWLFDDVSRFIRKVSFDANVGVALNDPSAQQLLSGQAAPDFISVDSAALARKPSGGATVSATPMWVWLDLSGWHYADLPQAVTRLARELSYIFSCGAETVFIRDPWSLRGVVDSQGNVAPFGLAVANLIHELANFEYSGSIALPGGTPNAVFTRGKETRVLVWPQGEPIEERIFLGGLVQVSDVFGRKRELELREGENVFTVVDMPLILHGVDPAVVKTRQTLRVEPEMVDSIYKLQPVYVTFVNEFAMSIVGELSVEFPPLWDADPETFFVRLKPGETFRRQTHLLVPYNAIAGPQEVRVTLDLGGSGTQKTRIIRQVELGSSTFRMDVETRPTAGELAVYQKVTNTSEAAADVSAFLEAEGLARKEQPPRVLPSGSSTTFVYRLQGESRWAGKKLRLAVRDRNTDRFLNVELTVPASGAPR